MRIKKIVSAFILCAFLCTFVVALASCGNNDNGGERDTEIIIVAQGLSATKKLKLDLTNVVTNEKYQVNCSSTWGWRGRIKLDYGTYRVDSVSTNGIDSDVSCERQTFVVNAETKNVNIVVQETDHTGTFLWFLQKNALTLTGLGVCIIGVAIIKSKKNKSTSVSSGMS